MANLLRANLYRMRKSLVVWGGAVVCVMMFVFTLYTHVSDRDQYGFDFVLDQLFFIYTTIVGFLMSIIASTTLGTEYDEGTIRNKLAVGHVRQDVYLANLISMTVISWLYCGVYMLVATALGVPFAGWLTADGKLIAVTILGALLLEMAFSAIYTAVSMNCRHKATTAIICILLFFLSMVASTYIYNMLEAPPEHLAYSMVDGEFVSGMEPNPRYLEGTKRAVYEFLFDLLPTGQATQYFMLEFAHPVRMMLCAVGTAAAATLGGLASFRRKDLK